MQFLKCEESRERKRQSAKVGSFGERKRWWSVLLEFCVKKNHTHLCKAWFLWGFERREEKRRALVLICGLVMFNVLEL